MLIRKEREYKCDHPECDTRIVIEGMGTPVKVGGWTRKRVDRFLYRSPMNGKTYLTSGICLCPEHKDADPDEVREHLKE